MFMIMEVNESFLFEKKAEADRKEPEGSGMGEPDVDISTSITGSASGREMAIDGENLQA